MGSAQTMVEEKSNARAMRGMIFFIIFYAFVNECSMFFIQQQAHVLRKHPPACYLG
jgi:hypothetical protein